MCAAMMTGGLLNAATGNKPMGMAGLIPAALQNQQRKKPATPPMSGSSMASAPPPSTMMK